MIYSLKLQRLLFISENKNVISVINAKEKLYWKHSAIIFYSFFAVLIDFESLIVVGALFQSLVAFPMKVFKIDGSTSLYSWLLRFSIARGSSK